MNLLQKFWDRHVVLLMLTALFWAGNAVAGRIAIDDVSPFLLSFLRWFILLIFLWIFLYINPKFSQESKSHTVLRKSYEHYKIV